MDLLVNIGLYLTYALFAIALLVLAFFSIKQFFVNLAKSKTSLYSIIGLLVVFGLAYALASGTDISKTVFEKVGTAYDLSRLIGAGLIMTYLLFGGVVLSLLAVEVMKPFKK